MKVVKETIGGAEVFIQTVDDDLEIVGETQKGRATQPTGIEETFSGVYTKLKSVIRGIAEDISAEVRGIDVSTRPEELEIEFNLNISGQAGIWILSGQSNSALRVKMAWNLKDTEN